METRAAGLYLVPFHYEIDGSTGHHTWHCRIEEVDKEGNVMQGPQQLHGVDTPHLNRHHGGEHKRFLLEKIKPAMIAHYKAWKQDESDAQELKGQSL